MRPLKLIIIYINLERKIDDITLSIGEPKDTTLAIKPNPIET